MTSDARESAMKYAESTRDWAAPKVEAAKDWAGPRVEPVAARVKDDVLPKVAAAVAAALAASEPAREEAKTRGTAAIAALRGEVEAPKPKKHRLRKLFLLAGVVGAAVAGWKAWVGQTNRQPEPWATPIGTASSAGVGTVGRPDRVPAAPAAAPLVAGHRRRGRRQPRRGAGGQGRGRRRERGEVHAARQQRQPPVDHQYDREGAPEGRQEGQGRGRSRPDTGAQDHLIGLRLRPPSADASLSPHRR